MSNGVRLGAPRLAGKFSVTESGGCCHGRRRWRRKIAWGCGNIIIVEENVGCEVVSLAGDGTSEGRVPEDGVI